MVIDVAARARLRNNRLRKKGVTVQTEKILRAALHVARLRESSPNAHAYRIRTAKRLCDLLESFIAEEVHRATRKSKSDPTALSWAETAQLLDVSKTAAYSRYKEDKK